MKKILTVLLLWTALCGTAFPQNTSDFTVNADGVITKYNGFDTDIKIPATIGGKSITGIGKEAFQKTDLTSVTIPDSVTEIGESAFAQNQLTSVTIGTGVKTIGKSAFSGNKLASVTIPNGVIGESAFAGNQLTSVTIGNGVTYIGKSAFSGNKLASVTIPNSVTEIGESAFAQNQLTSVTIGNGVTSIGKSAFSGNKFTSVTIPNSVRYIDDLAFSNNQLTSVTVASGSVDERAFYNNPALATIVLSEGVSSIGKEAFANTKCTSVSLPSTVSSIDASAFDTSGKPSFTLAANINANFSFFPMFYSYIANDRKAGTYAFDAQSVRKNADGYEYYENQYGAVLTNYTGDSARVRIPAEIGGVTVKALFGTFNKKPVEAVQIPEKITFIGEEAFAGSKLAGVTIPNGVTGIGRLAFRSCSNLTSVTIPASVTSIGRQAFGSCSNLTSVTFQGTIPSANFDGAVDTSQGNTFRPGTFPGDLRAKFYATDKDKGTPGTYTRTNGSSETWTKQ